MIVLALLEKFVDFFSFLLYLLLLLVFQSSSLLPIGEDCVVAPRDENRDEDELQDGQTGHEGGFVCECWLLLTALSRGIRVSQSKLHH